VASSSSKISGHEFSPFMVVRCDENAAAAATQPQQLNKRRSDYRARTIEVPPRIAQHPAAPFGCRASHCK